MKNIFWESIRNDPRILLQFLLQLMRRPASVTDKKSKLGLIDIFNKQSFFELFEISTPVDIFEDWKARFQRISNAVQKIQRFLLNRSTEVERGANASKFFDCISDSTQPYAESSDPA